MSKKEKKNLDSENLPNLEPSKEVDLQTFEEDDTKEKQSHVKEVEVDHRREEEKKLQKGKSTLIFVLAAIVLIVMSFVGYYIYASNPKRVLVTSLDALNNKINQFYTNASSEMGDTKDPFTMTGTMEFDISSDLFTPQVDMYEDPEIYEQAEATTKLFENLKNTDFHYTLKQDTKNQKLLFQLTPELNGGRLTSLTYYHEMGKQYLSIPEIADTYLQLDDFDLFSAVEETKNSNLDDYNYIVDVVKNSLYENITEKDFEESYVKIKVDGKDKNVKRVIFHLDVERANELLEAVVADLKSDEQAREIMTSMIPDFANYEVQEPDTTSQSELKLITYVTRFSHEPLKYAVMIYDGDTKQESGIAYTDGERDEIEFIRNEKVISTIEINGDMDDFKVEWRDENDKKLGTISGSYEEQKMNFEVSLENGELGVIACHVNSEQSENNTDSNMGCGMTTVLNQNLFTFEVTDSNVLENEAEFDVDIDGSRKMTEEDSENLNLWFQQLMERIAMGNE